jgi:hypothetical protein
MKIFLFSILFIYITGSYTFSQCDFPILVSDTTSTLGIYQAIAGYSFPSFVDIDNDGDMDAFIGEKNGTINYYNNTGNSTNAQFSLQTSTSNPFSGIDVGYYSTPSFADIDNDGDVDVFIGELYGKIYYYKNTGSVSNPVFTIQNSSANPFNGIDVGYYSAPTFVDIDNDGDVDCFIGEDDGIINYYKNTGSSTSPLFSTQTSSSNPFNGVDIGDNSTPTFIDIDNDGDIDAFIGEQDGTINYYKNTGSSTSPLFSTQTSSSNPFNGVDIGDNSTSFFIDIDNDGDMDAFIGEYNGIINYYKNTGSLTSPIFTEPFSPDPLNGVDVGGSSTPSFTDIDNDGDVDAFIGAYDGAIYYYKNTGSSTTPLFSLQTSSSNPFNSVDVGDNSIPSFIDIDNDGDMDAFIGESDGTIYYYKNTGSSTNPQFSLQTPSDNPCNWVNVVFCSTPSFVDIDSDGDMDAFFGEYDGGINFYENTGNSTSPVFTSQIWSNPLNINVGHHSIPFFVDIDNDGDMDAFIGEDDGVINYYKNTGSSTSPQFSLQTTSSNPFDVVDVGWNSTPSFVDIDNDGDIDVFIGKSVGSIDYFSQMCYDNTVTSIPAFEKENNHLLKVYPNPAQNIIRIELLENAPLQSIEIYNLIGGLIYFNNNIDSQQQISVDKLSNGIYLLEVKTANEIYTTKVCITH